MYVIEKFCDMKTCICILKLLDSNFINVCHIDNEIETTQRKLFNALLHNILFTAQKVRTMFVM